MNLTDRFADALGYAERLHRNQKRKGNDVPYIAHLLAVAATILEWGGDEDTAIAGLLHDAVEDQGGVPVAEEIRARYGGRVADLVMACTDSVAENPGEKPPWEERKRRHIEKIRTAPAEVALITAADKLHNLTATVRDMQAEGAETLKRFARPEMITWYYAEMIEALERHADRAPVDELRRQLQDLTGLIDASAVTD